MRRELYHELKLLNQYYDVDEENKTVTIPLKYEKASDIIDLNVEAKNNYPISDPVMVSIVEKISTIPPGYKVKLNLIINDYEDYDKEILLQSLNDFLEFNHYSIIREKKFFFIQAIILLAIGISILVFNVFAKTNNLFSEESVLTEVFDIIAWVFVWQATTVAFLTPSEFDVNSTRFKLRVKSIALLDKDKNILVEEDTLEKFKDWVGNKKKEKFARLCLLLSGGALFIAGAMHLVDALSNGFNVFRLEAFSREFVVMMILFVTILIIGIIEVLVGISALSSYNGRGPFSKKARFVFIPLMSIVLVLNILTFAYGYATSPSEFLSAIISILASLGYVVGTIMTMKLEVKITEMEIEEKSIEDNKTEE